MCGITGLYEYATNEPVSEEILRKMTASLVHRGPDAEGIQISGNVGLGHRRLTILDISEKGNQPMQILNGEISISFNGEIYNYRQLRKDLEQIGHSFFSLCDTEVILRAYHEWGIDCLDRISGIFAFAIWDNIKQTLFLARDPLGVKPLFYSIDSECFRFASEIKAILCDPRVKRDICDEGLDTYFSFSYSAAPLTGLQAVKQLLPGHYALVTSQGLSTARYWQISYKENENNQSFEDILEGYRDIFDRVVARQLVSDVPTGVFISGGLDSSAIAEAICRTGNSSITGFSAGFSESSFNEIHFARQIAETLNMELVEQMIDFDIIETIHQVSQFTEEPFADSSMLAVYLLCKMTSQHVKVVLSGDGADELLAGYDTYRANDMARTYRRIPYPLRKYLIQPLVKKIPVSNKKYNFHQVVNRFVQGAEEGPGRDHCFWRIMLNESLKKELYNQDFFQRTATFDPVQKYVNALEGPPTHFNTLASYLNADLTFYLPNDMLVKVDRMSMAHGLEVRVPFLDPEMVNYCMNLRPEAKVHRGKTRKHILRESLRNRIPSNILNRPKSGFNVPIDTWMRRYEMRDFLLDHIMDDNSNFSNYLSPKSVELLWNKHSKRHGDYGHVLFTILMFALWCKRLKSISYRWQ